MTKKRNIAQNKKFCNKKYPKVHANKHIDKLRIFIPDAVRLNVA